MALAFFGSARAPADPGASEFSDRKTGADLEVSGSSSTFLAAVVLDPWACTAGGFGDCGDSIKPEVQVEEERFGTRDGCNFGGFWWIADTADPAGFWWMADTAEARDFTAGGLADSAISVFEAAGSGGVADNLVGVDDLPV